MTIIAIGMLGIFQYLKQYPFDSDLWDIKGKQPWVRVDNTTTFYLPSKLKDDR